MGNRITIDGDRDLSSIALDIAGVLTMVDEHLGRILCGAPEVAERGTEYVQGLALAVESARELANYLFGALDSLETHGPAGLRPSISAAGHAPKGPRENIGQPLTLPEGFDVAGALVWLKEVEESTANMTAEECASELAGYNFDVAQDLTPDLPCDGYNYGPQFLATHSWTLKGLRYAVARERFLESINAVRDLLQAETEAEASAG